MLLLANIYFLILICWFLTGKWKAKIQFFLFNGYSIFGVFYLVFNQNIYKKDIYEEILEFTIFSLIVFLILTKLRNLVDVKEIFAKGFINTIYKEPLGKVATTLFYLVLVLCVLKIWIYGPVS